MSNADLLLFYHISQTDIALTQPYARYCKPWLDAFYIKLRQWWIFLFHEQIQHILFHFRLSSEIRVFGSKVVAKKHKIGIILLKIGFTLTLEPEMLKTW